MNVKECLTTTIIDEEKEMKYFYRLTEVNFRNGQAFGIEIERQDFVEGSIVRLERDSIEVISNNQEKVKQLFDKVFENVLSPIHLVDVIGEYCDEYVVDFELEEKLLLTV